MIYPDIQIVLIYILIRIYGNIAGIAVRCISFHVADGIAVMHQTIALVVMICFIISAVYLYSFFAGQFNERLRSVWGCWRFRLVCGGLLSIVYYGEYNGKILACRQSPAIILPLKSNISALFIRIERVIAVCFIVLGNIFRRVYRDCAGVCVTIFCYCTRGVASIQKAVTLCRMSSVSGNAFDLYVIAANQPFYIVISGWCGSRRCLALGGVVYGHNVFTAGREKLPEFTVSRGRTAAAAGSKFKESFTRIAFSIYKGICIVRGIEASLIVIWSVTIPNCYRERRASDVEFLIASDYCIELKRTRRWRIIVFLQLNVKHSTIALTKIPCVTRHF